MAAAAGAIAVPVPVPIALSPSLSPSPCPHPWDTLLAASTLPSVPPLPPRCHRAVTAPVPAPRATCHPARGNGMEKSARVAAGPKIPRTVPRMDLGHCQSGETEARGCRRCHRVPKIGRWRGGHAQPAGAIVPVQRAGAAAGGGRGGAET